MKDPRERVGGRKSSVGVVGLCPGTAQLELRQVCVCSILFLFFGRLGGMRLGSPTITDIPVWEKDICETHRYAEQLSWSMRVTYSWIL
jgi:hypothetical protein